MHLFRTAMGVHVPDVGADRMRDLDRVAVADFGIDLLQMMANAGRALAATVRGMVHDGGSVTVLAGSGGNGGGGLAAARHLHGREAEVRVILARPDDRLSAATAHQLRTLRAIGVRVEGPANADRWIGEAEVAIDALVGYGATGPAEGAIADLIRTLNRWARRIGLTSYATPFRTEDRVPLQCTGTWSTRCRDVPPR